MSVGRWTVRADLGIHPGFAAETVVKLPQPSPKSLHKRLRGLAGARRLQPPCPRQPRAIGGSGLHTRLSGNALEIGYWIHKDFINKGLVSESTAALTKVAFEVYHVERMEIHCSVENLASAAVPRKLGYIHEATRRRLGFAGGRQTDSMIWTLFADEYPSTPCASAELEAFDVIGKQLL